MIANVCVIANVCMIANVHDSQLTCQSQRACHSQCMCHSRCMCHSQCTCHSQRTCHNVISSSPFGCLATAEAMSHDVNPISSCCLLQQCFHLRIVNLLDLPRVTCISLQGTFRSSEEVAAHDRDDTALPGLHHPTLHPENWRTAPAEIHSAANPSCC